MFVWDSLKLRQTGCMRVGKSPVTGDYVGVRGPAIPDGTIDAERIRRR